MVGAGLKPDEGHGGAVTLIQRFESAASRNAPRAQSRDPVGLPFAEMDAAQRAQVLTLIGAFADHRQPELVQARLACGGGGARHDRQVRFVPRIDGRLDLAHRFIEADDVLAGEAAAALGRDLETSTDLAQICA